MIEKRTVRRLTQLKTEDLENIGCLRERMCRRQLRYHQEDCCDYFVLITSFFSLFVYFLFTFYLLTVFFIVFFQHFLSFLRLDLSRRRKILTVSSRSLPSPSQCCPLRWVGCSGKSLHTWQVVLISTCMMRSAFIHLSSLLFNYVFRFPLNCMSALCHSPPPLANSHSSSLTLSTSL